MFFKRLWEWFAEMQFVKSLIQWVGYLTYCIIKIYTEHVETTFKKITKSGKVKNVENKNLIIGKNNKRFEDFVKMKTMFQKFKALVVSFWSQSVLSLWRTEYMFGKTFMHLF